MITSKRVTSTVAQPYESLVEDFNCFYYQAEDSKENSSLQRGQHEEEHKPFRYTYETDKYVTEIQKNMVP